MARLNISLIHILMSKLSPIHKYSSVEFVKTFTRNYESWKNASENVFEWFNRTMYLI